METFSNQSWCKNFNCKTASVTAGCFVLWTLFVCYFVRYQYLPTHDLNEVTVQDAYFSNGGLPSEASYLNPFAMHSLGDIGGTCPYVNPTYPSIGPDTPILCPQHKRWRQGISWFFKHDINGLDYTNSNYNDKQNNQTLQNFFSSIEMIKDVFIEFGSKFYPELHSNGSLITHIKNADELHLTYQYLSCQNKNELQSWINDWNNIIKDSNYIDIFQKYNKSWNKWEDIEICFDKVLCSVGSYAGSIGYNLYLDYKSQMLLKELIDTTEYIEENNYNIKLSFHRNKDQQSFHVTLGSMYVNNNGDRTIIDYKQLMDYVNEKNIQIPCIKLNVQPQISAKTCYSTREIDDKRYKFKWQCVDIGND